MGNKNHFDAALIYMMHKLSTTTLLFVCTNHYIEYNKAFKRFTNKYVNHNFPGNDRFYRIYVLLKPLC